MTLNGIECIFHHMGIPTTEPRVGERYSEIFGMYTSDSICQVARVQWHRFDPDSCLHPLLRTVPHLAFRVSDLQRAISGCQLLLGPYEPISGFLVAAIEDGGQPIELIQTSLTDEQIWSGANADSMLYQQRPKQ